MSADEGLPEREQPAAGGPSPGEFGAAVHACLRAMAQQRMASERRDHTLQATALVNEAYLRLMGDGPVRWENRAHFYAAAAEAMRGILIDHARRKGAVKRGGGWKRTIASVEQLAAEASESEIVALDRAFLRLQEDDPRAASVVRLRFYAGLTVDQTTEVMGISRRGVLRDWEYARAFLLAALAGEE